MNWYLLIFSILIREFSQSSFQVDPTKAEGWLKQRKEKFNPASWSDSSEVDSLERFLQVINNNKEVYVFMHNRNDNGTFSMSPFFKTTSKALHDVNPTLPILTVDMEKSPEIAGHFGIPPSHTITLYFHRRAPIILKYDQIEKSKRPVEKWMKKVKSKIEKIQKIETENDLDLFENSNKLMLIIVDKEKEYLGEMFASVSYNYLDLDFSYMVRDESTRDLENQINSQYGFDDITEGGKVNKSILIQRSDHVFRYGK
jgi:hypothetical protein